MNRMRHAMVFGVWLLTVTATRIAEADVAPAPVLSAVTQEQQNVKITVQQESDFLNAYPIDIVRSQAAGDVIVVSDVNLGNEHATSEEKVCGDDTYAVVAVDDFCTRYPDDCLSCPAAPDTTCIGTDCDDCLEVDDVNFSPRMDFSDEEFCGRYSDYKVDCDMDGTAECCLDCKTIMYFDFWDECVPGGPTEYLLASSDEFGDSLMEGESISIDVADAGASCEAPSTDDSETTSDSVGSDSAGSDAVGSDAVGSDAVGSDAVESDAVESDAVGSDVVESDAVESDGVESDGVESDGVESDGVESDGVESDVVESDAPPSSDEPEESDEAESSDEPKTSDEAESSDEPKNTDEAESSDEPTGTDEAESSDEDSDTASQKAKSESDSGCSFAPFSKTATPVQLIEFLMSAYL